jgi:hypothetical protein
MQNHFPPFLIVSLITLKAVSVTHNKYYQNKILFIFI